MSQRPDRTFKGRFSGLFRQRTRAHSASSSTTATSASSAAAAQQPDSGSKDFVVSNTVLILDIVEKLSGFAQTIPFIAPAAGFLSQIVKAYKEVQDTQNERDALLGVITGISQDLCATVLRMEATNHLDMIGRLKSDVEAYARLLEESFKFISDYDRLGGATRAAARQPLKTGLEDLQRKLDSFGARFRNNRLVDLAIHQSTMKNTLDQVHDMAVEKRLEEWLQSPLKMRQKQHEMQKLRKEGTGRWFLEGEAFIEWQNNAGSVWIQGASGMGKSVLSSSVIQKLIDDQQLFAALGKPFGLGFFYFDFKSKDGNAVETALRRIILQLSAQAPRPFSALDRCYCLSRGQVIPNYTDLQRMLTGLLQELGRVYIILDALDECPEAELAQLIAFIAFLREWTHTPLHLIFTSQPRAVFTQSFVDIPSIVLEPNAIQCHNKT